MSDTADDATPAAAAPDAPQPDPPSAADAPAITAMDTLPEAGCPDPAGADAEEPAGLEPARSPWFEPESPKSPSSLSSPSKAATTRAKFRAAAQLSNVFMNARALGLRRHVVHPMQACDPEEEEELDDQSSFQIVPPTWFDFCSKEVVFIVLCLLTFLYSGGVMLGIGPFMQAMADQGYFGSECNAGEETPCDAQYDLLSAMVNGGIQILNFGTVAVTYYGIPYGGPRLVGVSGTLLAGVASMMLWSLSKDDSYLVFMVAYGFMLLGMTSMYLALMGGMIGMFDKVAMRVCVLSGLFNAAGAVTMFGLTPLFLDADVESFALVYGIASIPVAVVVAIVFPPFPYAQGEDFKVHGFRWWETEVTEPSESELEQSTDQSPRSPRDLDRQGTDIADCIGTPRSPRSQDEAAAELAALKAGYKVGNLAQTRGGNFYRTRLKHALTKPRFWWFCFCFGWCTVVLFVVGGQFGVIATDKASGGTGFWNNYMFPTIGNLLVGVWGPLVGLLAGHTGLWVIGLCTVVCTQLLGLCCYIPGDAGLVLILFFYSWVNAFSFSLQYAYITISFPVELYSPLLAISMVVQGILGFTNWPILNPNPFGDTEYRLAVMVVLIPTVLCYVFPWIQRENDKYRDNFLNSLLLRSNHMDILNEYLKYDVNKDGELDRSEVEQVVRGMFTDLGATNLTERQQVKLDTKIAEVVDLMFELADTNSDGLIDLQELEKLTKSDDDSYEAARHKLLEAVHSVFARHAADRYDYSSHDQGLVRRSTLLASSVRFGPRASEDLALNYSQSVIEPDEYITPEVACTGPEAPPLERDLARHCEHGDEATNGASTSADPKPPSPGSQL